MSRLLRISAAIHMARAGGANLERRRRYATDPFAYARDVFGYRLTKQQEEVLDAVHRETRVLIPAAQNVGKTWILALGGLWLFDAVSALPGPEGQLQQGARILLPGPDANSVFGTVYLKIVGHAMRAESRGWRVPGTWSEQSVLWRVEGHPEWSFEKLTPPKKVGQGQAHGAAGRHHVNQHALIEEGNGVSEALWTAVEGTCSGAGNKIISPYNPTEPVGPAVERERTGTYKVLRLSALDHPNVKTRKTVVPGAVGHARVDDLVKDHTIDQGAFPGTPLDPQRGDFVYALPPLGAVETGRPRRDGVAGHPAGAPRVRRPLPAAEVSVLGRTAMSSVTGLFSADSIARAQQRWRDTPAPAVRPSRVGADPARTGADDSCAAPAWGESAEVLLRAYHDAQQRGPAAIAALATRRIRIGVISVLPKGDGPRVATALVELYPNVPFTIDDGGVGTSPIDHLRSVIGAQVGTVSFGGAPPSPPPGGHQAENMRSHMYLLLAMLLARDLVDLPPDPALTAELLAHRIEYRSKSVPSLNGSTRVTSVLLEAKDKVKERIGRSPDRADTAVLAVTEPPPAIASIVAGSTPTRAEYGRLRARYGPDTRRT